MKKIDHFAFLLFLGSLLLPPGFALGQSTFDGGGDGTTWNDADNWDPNGIPVGVNANIGDTFTVSLSTTQSVNELDLVGDQSTGTAVLNHSAGTLSHAGGWMKIGVDSGNDGTYNLSGTAATTFSSGALYMAHNGGTGTLDLSGNASFSGGGINAGLNSAATATINVADTATLAATDFNLGNGTVNQTGGTVSASSWLAIGKDGGSGAYNISGGSVTASADYFTIGETNDGSLNVSGSGTVNAAALGMLVGRDNGIGLLEVDGSQASVSATDLRVGLGLDPDTMEVIDTSANGILRWIADPLGITPIVSADNTEFSPGDSKLSLDFSADPLSSVLGTEYLLIDNAAPVTGTFAYRPEGSTVNIGGGNTGTISYVGGTDGFDVVVTVAAAPPSTPLSSFCSDFEDLVPGAEYDPIGDGWLFFDTNGPFPSYDGDAPQGPQISNLADADGDPGKSGAQDLLGGGGNKYLNIFSDYNNPQTTVALTNNVFQEQTFTAADADLGQTYTLSFDYAGAEDPFYPGASGSATTAAFIRVLDTNNAILAQSTFDTSAATSLVFALGKVSLTFDEDWDTGGTVQFGFTSTRTDFEPTGIYYDNVCFAVLGDANDDGQFNNVDIAFFVLALTNSKMYAMMFPDVDPNGVLDMNCDGVFTNKDISFFVAALTGP